MNFKKNLRAEMEYTKISVKELSHRTGISQSTLNNYLGKKAVHPTLENGVKIARAIGVSAERLIYGKEQAADSKETRAIIEIVRKMPEKRQVRLLKLLTMFAPSEYLDGFYR